MACCLPTCAKGLSVPDEGNASFGIFWVLWFLLGVLCTWGVLALLSPCCVQDLGYFGVPPTGHALWAEVGGGITFVTSWKNT